MAHNVDSIVYRNTTVNFTGKGSLLTSLEGDYNNFKIATDVTALFEQMLAVGAGIESITQPTPNTLLITLTDATTFGPFTLPTAPMTGRGQWTPNTNYQVNDLLYNGTALYVVPFAHISEATFDPGANDGAGNNFYDLIFDFALSANALRQATTDTETAATHTLTSEDLGKFWLCTNTGGCVITIPNDTGYDAPIDTEISFCQMSDGPLSVVAQSPATYNDGVVAFSAETADIGAVFTIKKIAAQTWIGWGRFVEPTA